MNIFIIHSTNDRNEVQTLIDELQRREYKASPLMLKKRKAFWKTEAAAKIKKAQMVVFFAGKDSHTSPHIGWELKQARKYDKPIYTIFLKEGKDRHTALRHGDDYSGKKDFYDELITFDTLKQIINSYKQGDYHIFNQPLEQIDKGLLLEQYKIFLQTSEDLVNRRQNVNNFYISINSAIIALFSATFMVKLPERFQPLIGAVISVVGIVLSISWIKMLVAYGNLNASKFKIINSIEKQMPVSLYDAEWAALSDKLNEKRYVSFTDNEKQLPILFIVIYSVILVFLILSMVL